MRTQLPQPGVLQRSLRLLPPRGVTPCLPLLNFLCLLLGHYHHHPAQWGCMRAIFVCRQHWLAPLPQSSKVLAAARSQKCPTAAHICFHRVSFHHASLFEVVSAYSWAMVSIRLTTSQVAKAVCHRFLVRPFEQPSQHALHDCLQCPAHAAPCDDMASWSVKRT